MALLLETTNALFEIVSDPLSATRGMRNGYLKVTDAASGIEMTYPLSEQHTLLSFADNQRFLSRWASAIETQAHWTIITSILKTV